MSTFAAPVRGGYDGPQHEDETARRHSVAIGLVGGLFDLISDWLLDADLTDEPQIESLTENL